MRLLPLLLLCSCGADFTGQWMGTLDEVTTCSDTTERITDSKSVRWTILDKGEAVTVTPVGGSCGNFEGRATGLLVAALSGKDCPDWTAAGYYYDAEFRSGLLEMDESRAFFGVTLGFVYVVTQSGRNVATCNKNVAGRMTIER